MLLRCRVSCSCRQMHLILREWDLLSKIIRRFTTKKIRLPNKYGVTFFDYGELTKKLTSDNHNDTRLCVMGRRVLEID